LCQIEKRYVDVERPREGHRLLGRRTEAVGRGIDAHSLRRALRSRHDPALGDYAADVPALESNPNPFAAVVLAHRV
jgi:hypothetical protein